MMDTKNYPEFDNKLLLGEMTPDIFHSINNHLSILMSGSEFFRYLYDAYLKNAFEEYYKSGHIDESEYESLDDDFRDLIDDFASAVTQITELGKGVQAFYTYGKTYEPTRTKVKILLEAAKSFTYSKFRKANSCKICCDDDVYFNNVNPGDLLYLISRVMIFFFNNAIEVSTLDLSIHCVRIDENYALLFKVNQDVFGHPDESLLHKRNYFFDYLKNFVLEKQLGEFSHKKNMSETIFTLKTEENVL